MRRSPAPPHRIRSLPLPHTPGILNSSHVAKRVPRDAWRSLAPPNERSEICRAGTSFVTDSSIPLHSAPLAEATGRGGRVRRQPATETCAAARRRSRCRHRAHQALSRGPLGRQAHVDDSWRRGTLYRTRGRVRPEGPSPSGISPSRSPSDRTARGAAARRAAPLSRARVTVSGP